MTDEADRNGELDPQSLLTWSRTEQRLFLITTLATTTGAVIAAALIGLAFLAARSANTSHLKPQGWAFLVFVTTIGAVTSVLGLRAFRKKGRDIFMRLIVTYTVLITAFLILMWVGLAAGIK